MNRLLIAATAAIFILAPASHHAAVAQETATADHDFDKFIGAKPTAFDGVDALVGAFKSGLSSSDKQAVAKLLGLDPAAVAASKDSDGSFPEIRDAAAQSVTLDETSPDRRILVLGDKAWPFPFPVVKADGKWSFDTVAGLEEVINRRIGENELTAIAAMRSYVYAQQVYHKTDWDEDGVLEYAQNLVSTPGTYDGLYWHSGDGIPESPAGEFVDEKALQKPEDGYFGYRYRILKSQGANIAGGAYDYVINGNMIGGFALIATPAHYDRSGIMTFVVNQYGTVYQKDLGSDSGKAAAAITTFNPDDSWTVVDEPGD